MHRKSMLKITKWQIWLMLIMHHDSFIHCKPAAKLGMYKLVLPEVCMHECKQHGAL